MKTYMMEIKELKFSYGFKKPDIFSDFSLTLQPGAVYGLLGKNGTGKSTLLYLMCGLLRPKSGSVTFCGSEMSRRQPSALQEIFIVPEEFTLPAVTLAQYVKYNTQFYPRFSNEILNNCLRDFEMDGNLRLNELSMGQKKKAFMSFALATNTRLLLMDEPTNGFDIPSKSQMRKVIASNMSDEKTIVVSTHQVRDVENLLDHVLMVDSGKLLLDSSYATLASKLLFTDQPMSEPTEGAIYVQPSLQGNSAIYANRFGDESVINLETLFNAMLANGAAINEALNTDDNDR